MLGEVIASIRGALASSAQARQALIHAADRLDEAHQYLSNALAGSHDPEAHQGLAFLTQARSGIDAAHQTLIEAENRARRYRDRLGADATDDATTNVSSQPNRLQPSASGIRSPSAPPTPERIEQLRGKLPPSVTSGTGQKTHGRWIDADGREHVEFSGKDEKYGEAIQLFKGMKARRIPSRASDVEMKLAAHMRKNGIRSATLVVNHVPCEGPLASVFRVTLS